MIDYLKGLNERERWALITGTVVCIVYLGYLLIYVPLTAGVQRRALILAEKKETLQWIKQAQVEYQPSRERKTISNTQLLALISQALNKQLQGFTYQLQQTGAGNIQLMYDAVPFNAFMRWLYAFNEEYAVFIQELIVDKTDTSGVVKLILVITPS